jgi:hypothetical protein
VVADGDRRLARVEAGIEAAEGLVTLLEDLRPGGGVQVSPLAVQIADGHGPEPVLSALIGPSLAGARSS